MTLHLKCMLFAVGFWAMIGAVVFFTAPAIYWLDRWGCYWNLTSNFHIHC